MADDFHGPARQVFDELSAVLTHVSPEASELPIAEAIGAQDGVLPIGTVRVARAGTAARPVHPPPGDATVDVVGLRRPRWPVLGADGTSRP